MSSSFSATAASRSRCLTTDGVTKKRAAISSSPIPFSRKAWNARNWSSGCSATRCTFSAIRLAEDQLVEGNVARGAEGDLLNGLGHIDSLRDGQPRASLDLQPVTESPALLALSGVPADAAGRQHAPPPQRHRSRISCSQAALGCVARLRGTGKEGEEIVGRLRRGAGGADNGAIVLAQDLEPGADIISMAHRRDDAERGADERARDLRHQLFLGVE